MKISELTVRDKAKFYFSIKGSSGKRYVLLEKDQNIRDTIIDWIYDTSITQDEAIERTRQTLKVLHTL